MAYLFFFFPNSLVFSLLAGLLDKEVLGCSASCEQSPLISLLLFSASCTEVNLAKRSDLDFAEHSHAQSFQQSAVFTGLSFVP